jgi:hypothetical protein|tara:strand:- start:11945 stop:12109 length:165 start_codon:yes stop_codon:yes gene_type:complete
MLSFFKNLFKKEEEFNTVTSVEFPDYLTIESLDVQSGGGNNYYDNIYSRNVSKL